MIRVLAVDSDGCVIDSMTEKHTRAFTPALIETWSLQSIQAEATKLALDINLYSDTRGLNRFAALALFFEKLGDHLGEGACKLTLPDPLPLRQWVETTRALSEDSLASALSRNPAPILRQALDWSREVNRRISTLPPASPFVEAAATLREAQALGLAIHVVSSANASALEAEWREANLLHLVSRLGSQGDGTKAALLQEAANAFGRDGVLMVGDARGDAEAAESAGVAYYPIRAGSENACWQKLRRHLPAFPPQGHSY